MDSPILLEGIFADQRASADPTAIELPKPSVAIENIRPKGNFKINKPINPIEETKLDKNKNNFLPYKSLAIPAKGPVKNQKKKKAEIEKPATV